MKEELLGNKVEYCIATEPTRCDSCDKMITIGQPVATLSSVRVEGAQIKLIRSFQCLTNCDDVQRMLTDAESGVRDNRPGVPDSKYISWDTADHDLKVYTLRGTWVATGFIGLCDMGNSRNMRFVEFLDSQIQKSNFVPDPQNDDPYGKFVTFKTGDNLRVRISRQTNTMFTAGNWYMPAWLVTPRQEAKAAAR
jgi:hypothetical protein